LTGAGFVLAVPVVGEALAAKADCAPWVPVVGEAVVVNADGDPWVPVIGEALVAKADCAPWVPVVAPVPVWPVIDVFVAEPVVDRAGCPETVPAV